MTKPSQTFEDLIVWQKAHAFVFRKRGNADKARFLNIAQSSLEECRYYLLLTNDLNYGHVAESTSLLTETSKLLYAYARKVLNSVS